MTITITTNNISNLIPYGQPGALVTSLAAGNIHINNAGAAGGHNFVSHLDIKGNIAGLGGFSIPLNATLVLHAQSDNLTIRGNIDLRFLATSTPHGVTVDSSSNITLQSESPHGLDLVINNNNPVNPTIVTLTSGAISSMIVNVDQNEYTIKNQSGERLTFGEFNAQEFDVLSQYIIDNYDQTTGSVNLANHQGELLTFKKYSKLLENANVWYTTMIDDFREYAPTPVLLSAADFINSHWLELNGVDMDQTNLELLPQEVMGYLAEYIIDGDIH